jgi:hypothetical protein
MAIPTHINLTDPAHVPAIKAEHARLGDYLQNCGASRDTPSRSSEAMADRRALSEAHLALTGEVLS